MTSENGADSDAKRQRQLIWLAGAGIWTVLGLLAASQEIAYRAHAGQPVEWGRMISRGLLDWYTCGIFTPFIVWIARRFPLSRGSWLAMLPAHLLACTLFILLKPALYLVFARSADWVDAGYVNRVLYGDLFAVTTAYWAVVAGTYALDYYRRYRERELRAIQLESRLARVQLDALKSQIHPHFLFNALNAVSSLMHRDVKAADRMVLELGELLRHTLNPAAAQEVTLRDELRMVDRYLAIMQIRLGDRLRVTREIQVEALCSLVPNLLLQPTVENALRHGIGRSASAGRLQLRAVVLEDMLEITVQDDGPGLAPGVLQEGIGLANTRMRLQQLYGEEHSVELTNAPGGGAVTRIRLPHHTSEISALNLVPE